MLSPCLSNPNNEESYKYAWRFTEPAKVVEYVGPNALAAKVPCPIKVLCE